MFQGCECLEVIGKAARKLSGCWLVVSSRFVGIVWSLAVVSRRFWFQYAPRPLSNELGLGSQGPYHRTSPVPCPEPMI